MAALAGNGRYCIRHAKGADITYEVAEITDPREPQLVSTRTIAVSPFPEDQGRVLYFGGYDCTASPPTTRRGFTVVNWRTKQQEGDGTAS